MNITVRKTRHKLCFVLSEICCLGNANKTALRSGQLQLVTEKRKNYLVCDVREHGQRIRGVTPALASFSMLAEKDKRVLCLQQKRREKVREF